MANLITQESTYLRELLPGWQKWYLSMGIIGCIRIGDAAQVIYHLSYKLQTLILSYTSATHKASPTIQIPPKAYL